MKWLFLWVILGAAFGGVYGQADSVAVRLEKIRTCDDDSLKVVYADEIVQLLTQSAYGTYSALKPVKYLGYKRCINSDAELFSWSFPQEDGLAFYNLFRLKRGGVYCLKSLPGKEPATPPYLFYDLLSFQSDGKEYFALLGWAQTKKTNQKAVLIARFDRNGQVNFKTPLLRKGRSKSASLTFEYTREAVMTLKVDKNGKRIIFDHLSPSDKKYDGYFMFYGPDASQDALVWNKKGWWDYKEMVKDGKNEKIRK